MGKANHCRDHSSGDCFWETGAIIDPYIYHYRDHCPEECVWAKAAFTVVELFCEMHIVAQKTTTTRFGLIHKSTFPQEGWCLSANQVRDLDGSNQVGLQHKFNGITFFNQKATKHHELVSFGLLAFFGMASFDNFICIPNSGFFCWAQAGVPFCCHALLSCNHGKKLMPWNQTMKQVPQHFHATGSW